MAKELFYQLYPIAWSNLKEMTSHLDRLHDLGVDYVWVSPLYSSPWYDHGYDVEDYCSIDLRFGTMKDFDNFVEKAHKLGIKVLMDLILNHTSVYHPWFRKHSDYYCWDTSKRLGWHNLFDNGPAWQFDSERGKYYLHLFHRNQADLNWFHGREVNVDLVREFRGIVRFWTEKHLVDGFRLDFPQALNKNFGRLSTGLDDLLTGEKAITIINAIFPPGNTDLTLIMECYDPTYGEIARKYTMKTCVSYVMNMLLKDSVKKGIPTFEKKLRISCQDLHYLLETESHDSPRFCSIANLSPDEVLKEMFGSKAQAICLYQGQELGLKNPTIEQLPDEDLLRLDAVTLSKFSRGENLSNLRRNSRANARIRLPLYEYDKQISKPDSCYNSTKKWIKKWKNT